MQTNLDEFILLSHFVETIFGLDSKPALETPASQSAISALEKRLKARGLRLPPSYQKFLSFSNGIRFFDGDMNLLPAEEVATKMDPYLEDDFPKLAKFVITGGNTSKFICFDSETTAADGEMEVVYIMEDNNEFRYPNFDLFLQQLIDELRKTLDFILKCVDSSNTIKEFDRKLLGG